MIMKDALKDTRVVSILRVGSVKSILNTMLDRLERCQKSLNEFLEEKRSSFPRLHSYCAALPFSGGEPMGPSLRFYQNLNTDVSYILECNFFIRAYYSIIVYSIYNIGDSVSTNQHVFHAYISKLSVCSMLYLWFC